MPSPTTAVTGRPELSPQFEEFDLLANAQGMIAPAILRPILVREYAGDFAKIDVAQLLQERNTARAPRTGYNRSTFQFTTDTYSTAEHGAEEEVDESERAMYSSWIEADQLAAARATHAVLQTMEQQCASLLFDATAFASYTAGVTHEWDDATNAVPISDVETAVRTVHANTGVWPNTLIISETVFRNIRQTDQVIERIESSGAGDSSVPGKITRQQLAEVFSLDRILVGSASKNTADEGQSASIAEIWDDEYALVCRTATSNDVRSPAVARAFIHAEESGGPGESFLITESYNEPQRRCEIIRVRSRWQQKLLGAAFGYLLSNITT